MEWNKYLAKEGFRKIDSERWEFANEEFIRGQKHLLKNIHRRKPIHSHSAQNSLVSLTDSERREFEQVIERLQREKSFLLLELQKHKQEKLEYEFHIRSLGERLRTIIHRQRQIIGLFAPKIQKSMSIFSHMQLSEDDHKKRRRLLISNYLDDEANVGENQMVTSQKENLDATCVSVLNLELMEKLESSLNIWGTFLHEFDQTLGEKTFDFGVLAQPSPVIVTEMLETSRDSDKNLNPPSPTLHPSSPDSMDIDSSPELAGSSSHLGSPAVSSIGVCVDQHPKCSGIDVNSNPANVPAVDASKEGVEEAAPPAVTTRVNDVFWEQFLTETPGSSDTQEAQSERRDISGMRNEDMQEDNSKFLWKMNNVDSHTEEQRGLITPARGTR
ncbi:heat stress transcription factor A-4b-like isoform X2 [Diospyros lotus]|uniref:heat stress transcription factor A-4b-like isoform X2 n=1 Tax=Diospyros lotus TaxID=55363 RepID=UPI002252CFEF|nr:heat stress transcription factor A-4b-like isoform X2 [Diospyros lotus]